MDGGIVNDEDPSSTTGSSDRAILAGLIAVTVWGSGSLILRSIDAGAPMIAFWRMALGVPTMWCAAWWFDQIPRRRVWRLGLLPGILFGASMPLGFHATLTTSIAHATLIGSLSPVVIMLGAGRFIGERTDPSKVPAALVAIGGIALVLLAGGHTSGASLEGDLAAWGNLAAWVGYFLMTKRHRDEGIGSWAYLAVIFTVGFGVTVVWSVMVGLDLGDVAGTDWFGVIGMVLLPGLVGHGLYTWSMQRLPAQLLSLFSLLNPVIATTGAWILLGEGLSPVQFLGAVLVLWGLSRVVTAHREGLRDPSASVRALPGIAQWGRSRFRDARRSREDRAGERRVG